MNRVQHIVTLTFLVMLLSPGIASATPQATNQVIVVPQGETTRVVTRRHRRPRPRRTRVVHYHHRSPARPFTTHSSSKDEAEEPVISLGLRAAGAAVDLSRASHDTINPPIFAGGGVSARVHLTPEWKLEFGVDALAKSTSRDTQVLVPLTVGSSFHFLPGSPVRPYLTAGLVTELSHLRPRGSRLALNTVDISAQGGAGVEFFVTPQLSLTTDLRAQGRLGTVSRELAMAQKCSPAQPCSNAELPQDARRHDMAMRFNAGINFHF